MCNGTDHDLIEIYRAGYVDDINAVVRWCSYCGAIVVDSEYDGRVKPGHYKKLQFPEIVKIPGVKSAIIAEKKK